ncbi:cupin domain-containing protein [Actinomadura sp. ATCC 31491]|uniref:Cupin domain-containing protein n=1 Tax=Actinomadura luzonensis TaxID=2805427 RepID=A0ABT0G2Y6_9ACTN|nr:cupin domain-containing protein [Actinomadura luzonensis]MCK2218488.1 cupin domain-containing protein [Actinomadura luzonensis]
MSTTTPDPARACRLVRPDRTYDGKQRLRYFTGIDAETVGARRLCMHLQTIPPGARGLAHLHQDHESAIYVLSGRVGAHFGDGLEHFLEVGEGEFFYIPPNVPHLPVNLSDTEPVRALLARSDPREQESTVLLPHLDALVEAHLDALVEGERADR